MTSRILLCLLVGGVAVAGSGRIAAETDVVVAESVEVGQNGMVLTTEGGAKRVVFDPDGLTVIAPEFHLIQTSRKGFEVKETYRFGKAFTVITNGKTCMIYERAIEEPAPNLIFNESDGGDPQVVVQAANNGDCGGCMVAGRSEADLEMMACVPGCGSCTCQLCWSQPCPPPEPDPDAWRNFCMLFPNEPGCQDVVDINQH